LGDAVAQVGPTVSFAWAVGPMNKFERGFHAMIDVQHFLATMIRRIMGRKIVSVLVVNSPSLGEDAQSGGVRYRREPQHETVDAFRARAAADAQRRGERSIVFGESRRGIIGTNERGRAGCDFIG